jgi:hypothetical protein
MIVEHPVEPLGDWLAAALPQWGLAIALVLAVLVLIGSMAWWVLGRRIGFDRASGRPTQWLVAIVADLTGISLRRVLTLAGLTVRESTRRHGLMGFLCFLLVIVALALLFLDNDSPDPAVLYIASLHWGVTLLVLVTVLLLGATSLPNDIKQKTIFTVVTKPVRASEVVLGRTIGVSAIGTGMLTILALGSYAFIYRGLDHRHYVDAAELTQLDSPSADVRALRTGRTSLDRHHRHRVTIDADGRGATDVVQGHWHEVEIGERGGQPEYLVGRPQGQFRARVPDYGTLRFIDRFGVPAAEGTDIGDPWSYHKYILGGSLAKAIWRFDRVTPERYPQGLRLDLNLLVRRTHKGDIERGVAGSLVLHNARTGLRSAPFHFLAKEFAIDPHLLPRQLNDSQGNSIDLFEHLVDQGSVELEVQCLDKDQFLGMAQSSVYLLTNEGSVAWNFVKGCASLWLRMVLVAAVAVTWSTFLHSAATVFWLAVGFARTLLVQIIDNQTPGGATFESLVRMVQHKEAKVPLEPSWEMNVVYAMDELVRWALWVIEIVTPDLGRYAVDDYLAQGFNIPAALVMQQGLAMLVS